jgi:hypothetical protein
LLAPRPTPTLEDQASVFISPRGRVAQLYPQAPGTHFSRLLRHACVTGGLFLFPGRDTGINMSTVQIILLTSSIIFYLRPNLRSHKPPFHLLLFEYYPPLQWIAGGKSAGA